MIPECPVRSHAEAYHQLRKTLGVHSSSIHSFDIPPVQYRDHKFAVGVECGGALEVGWISLNTRSGDLMCVRMKYMNSSLARPAYRMHIAVRSDQIMEIKDSGAISYD